MSVAAASPAEAKSASAPVSLWVTGLAGGIYILAALAVVFYGIPNLWQMSVGAYLAPVNSLLNGALQWTVQIAAIIGLAIFGISLAGPTPPRGIRGSIFLGISAMFTAFFLLRAVGLLVEKLSTKFILIDMIAFAFVGLLLFLFVKFLMSDRMTRWSIALEAAGWFDASSYKRNQGAHVRRLTIFGVILLLGSGVYTLVHNNTLPSGNWDVTLPFSKSTITLLPHAQFSVPILLVGLSIWFAWRVVNYPVFGDFLIATEAEINKVSWTPRARLIQDTIVVLITVFIITLFLFLVDIFWGWILSRELIGVLPSDADTKNNANTRQINKNEY